MLSTVLIYLTKHRATATPNVLNPHPAWVPLSVQAAIAKHHRLTGSSTPALLAGRGLRAAWAGEWLFQVANFSLCPHTLEGVRVVSGLFYEGTKDFHEASEPVTLAPAKGLQITSPWRLDFIIWMLWDPDAQSTAAPHHCIWYNPTF